MKFYFQLEILISSINFLILFNAVNSLVCLKIYVVLDRTNKRTD